MCSGCSPEGRGALPQTVEWQLLPATVPPLRIGRPTIRRGRKLGAAAGLAALVGSLPQHAEAFTTQISQTPFSTAAIGLAPGATISIELYNDHPQNNTVVLVLTPWQWVSWGAWLRTLWPPKADGKKQVRDLYLTSYWRADLYKNLTATFQIKAPTKDRYFVMALNLDRKELKLRGNLSLVNPGGEQLPLQQQGVPSVLLWISVLFFATCGVFSVLLLAASRRGRTAMHLMMLAVLLLKGIVVLLQWCDWMQISRTGTNTVLGRVGVQLLEKVQSILELMMFLLIALGWKFIRSSLNVSEVRFAKAISVISLYLGVFEVACTTPSACSGYVLSRYILHSLCYLVVIVAMNFNLQMIHGQITDAPASLESGKLYRKHQAYKLFRWIFLLFIIAPTIELFIEVTVLPWDAYWLSVLIKQLRTWAIYMCVAIAFRPDPPPLRVFELTREGGSDDDEVDGEADPGGADTAE